MAVDVVESGVRPRKGMPLPSRTEHQFRSRSSRILLLAKMATQVYDALVVAAAVEFCDRTLTRSTMNWGRRFCCTHSSS